ncbi:hypothetical protein JAAARDRAFT_142270 [Jaapia argillacea MUCL 33604]|uniref:Carbonic anhydrase n=1 Tax=Jaapia argillacea MUCL 33604 TaxID=933084 RepID=A0A067PIF9_9AGAM|nr:hypothetical protein JAAARDRAFT_142270 [Jaapia argillacea MUCL 33604]
MASEFPVLNALLADNEKWATGVENADPNFFPTSAKGPQRPGVLWIGCADSRVPESVITESQPGRIFVHRNIAKCRLTPLSFVLQSISQFGDLNSESILTFAVGSLHVSHVIVVGHTECGGVRAAHKAAQAGAPPADDPVSKWIRPIVEIALSLPPSADPQDINPLIRANIGAQVEKIVNTVTFQDKNLPRFHVHGWLYDLGTGRLRDLSMTQQSLGKERPE